MKLRPIVNKTSAPTYDLEKYMKSIYKDLIPESTYSIASNTELLTKINEFKLEKNNYLASFDVVSLFPSVNIEEMSKVINEAINKKYSDSEISNTLIRASNLIMNQNFFRFNEKIYKQNNGVPMGSPISSIIAEWKMRIIEEKIINDNKAIIKSWTRYVDDILVILKEKIEFPPLLEKLNKYDKSIQFTIEEEKNSAISFLDVYIIKKDSNFETTVYRKPGTELNIALASSKTPQSYKMSAIRFYIHRALKICSNKDLLLRELETIKNNAINKGYSRKNIEKIIKKTTDAFNYIKPYQTKNRYTTAVPYMNGVAIKMKKDFKKLDINLPIKPNPSIFQYIRSDIQPRNPLDTAGIYRINFDESNGKKNSYIGVTKRRISERLKEHVRDLKYEKDSTALSRKNKETPIKIDSLEIKKIANYNNHAYAYLREAIEITTLNPIVNEGVHGNLDERWRDMLMNPKKRYNEKRSRASLTCRSTTTEEATEE